MYFNGTKNKREYRKCASLKHIDLSLYDYNLEKMAIYSSWQDEITPIQTVLIGWTVFASLVCSMLAVFASAVEAFVEEAESLLQVMSVQSHHSVSHHPLLSN